MTIRYAFSGIVSVIVAFCTASAQVQGGFVAVGGAAQPEFEGADDYRAVPFAVLRTSAFGLGIEVEGLRTRIDLVDAKSVKAGPILNINLPRNDSITNNDTIALLDDVGTAIELGGFAGIVRPVPSIREGQVEAFVQLRQDVAGGHDGLLFGPEVNFSFAASRVLRFNFGAKATYANGSYMKSYFGIDAENAIRSGLDAFDAEAGWKDIGAETAIILSFSEKWGFLNRIAYTRLTSDAEISPIVDDLGSPNQVFLGTSLFRRW